MARMFLCCGMSGAGKTTFSKEFAENNDIEYLSPELFYERINGDEKIRDNKFLVWHTLFEKIHELEINGKDCIIDTNALSYVDREQFLDWFPTFEHHLIFIDAPLELCIYNNSNRDRVIPEEEMFRLWEKFELPDEYEDERWMTYTEILNEDNEFELYRIYVRINEELGKDK